VILKRQLTQKEKEYQKIGIPVNDTTFAEWKKRRDQFRAEGKEDMEKKRKFKTGLQLFKNEAELFKDDENATEVIEREDNQIEETMETTKSTNLRSEKEIMDELDNDIKGIKINAELFQGEENLDDLDNIDEENTKEEEQEQGEENMIEEEEKEMEK